MSKIAKMVVKLNVKKDDYCQTLMDVRVSYKFPYMNTDSEEEQEKFYRDISDGLKDSGFFEEQAKMFAAKFPEPMLKYLEMSCDAYAADDEEEE